MRIEDRQEEGLFIDQGRATSPELLLLIMRLRERKKERRRGRSRQEKPLPSRNTEPLQREEEAGKMDRKSLLL